MKLACDYGQRRPLRHHAGGNVIDLCVADALAETDHVECLTRRLWAGQVLHLSFGGTHRELVLTSACPAEGL